MPHLTMRPVSLSAVGRPRGRWWLGLAASAAMAGCMTSEPVKNEPAPAAECVLPGTGDGGLWDIRSWSIPATVFSETNTVRLTSGTANDALSLVVMLISVPHTATPPPVAIR